MNSFQLEKYDSSQDGNRVDFSIRFGDETHQIFFASKDTKIEFNLDALLAFSLPICMTKKADWLPQGQITKEIVDNLPGIMDFFQTWKPKTYRPKLPNITPIARTKKPHDRVGLFFTGGVDSYFTLFKNFDQITDLIYIHGLEMSLEKIALRNEISQMLNRVGRETGKNVIEIETNLRKFTSKYASRPVTHGFELVGAAYLLQDSLRQAWLSGGVSHEQMIMSSMHPDLIALMSSPVMKISVDGHALSRLEKIAILARQTHHLSRQPNDFIDIKPAHSQLVMETLRVCNENRGDKYNCGTCLKCLLTMIDLRLVNALEQFTSIKEPLDLRRVKQIDIHHPANFAFINNSVRELEQTKRDPELYDALLKAINQDSFSKRTRRWISKTKRKIIGQKSWY